MHVARPLTAHVFILILGFSFRYKCVSTANQLFPILCFCAINYNGKVFIVNKSGPTTEPWGTPKAVK